MLTVSEEAARAINALVTENQMPEGSGLRITRQGESTRSEGLGLSIAAAPADDESVIESNGAKVFLPPNLINVLDEQELQVEHYTEDGEDKQSFTLQTSKKAKS